jgi:hypothetical protein
VLTLLVIPVIYALLKTREIQSHSGEKK